MRSKVFIIQNDGKIKYFKINHLDLFISNILSFRTAFSLVEHSHNKRHSSTVC